MNLLIFYAQPHAKRIHAIITKVTINSYNNC